MLSMRLMLNIHFFLFGCPSGVLLSSALNADKDLWDWRVRKRAYLLIREDEEREEEMTKHIKKRR